MPVPDFQTLMRPLLEEYAAGGELAIADVGDGKIVVGHVPPSRI